MGSSTQSSATDREGMPQRAATSAELLKALFLFVRTAVVSAGDLGPASPRSGWAEKAGLQRRTGDCLPDCVSPRDKPPSMMPHTPQADKASRVHQDAGREGEVAGETVPRASKGTVKSKARARGSRQRDSASALLLRKEAMRCAHKRCTKFASYGDPLERVKRFCSTHKKTGNVDLKNRLCMFPEGCTSRATYGSFMPPLLPHNQNAAAAPTAGFGETDAASHAVSAARQGQAAEMQRQHAQMPRQLSRDGVAVGGEDAEQGLADEANGDVRRRDGHASANDKDENGAIFTSGLDPFCQGVAGADVREGRDREAFQPRPRRLELAEAWQRKDASADGVVHPAAEDSAAAPAAAAAAERSQSRSRSSSSGVEPVSSEGRRTHDVVATAAAGALSRRGRGRLPAGHVVYCAAHRRPCDVQLHRR